MTPQELKASILQLAIQGKLVEQRAEEGTAEELYQQIQKEKQRLIKAGVIKKEKPLPEIVEDEIPFDIPAGWKWVRLIDLCKSITDGDHQAPPQTDTGVPFLVISDVSSGNINFSNTRHVPQEYFNTLASDRIPEHGDMLFTVTGSYGIAIKVETEQRFCFQRHMALLKLMLDWDYVYYLLLSPIVKSQCDSVATGTAQKTVGLKSLRSLIVPLPPLAEQKRIVAKIEELLPYIDRYEQAWSRLEDFNRRFPVDMQKSILQMAIQGKLVEQRPEEGTGEELYQQIQQEKQRLIKAGTIKTEKPLPEITEDEIPFDIPEGWKWVRFSELMISMSTGPFGSMLHKSDYVAKGIPLVNPANIVRGTIVPSDKMMISTETAKRLESYTLHAGMIVMGRRGEMGRCAVVTDVENGWLCGTGSFFMQPSSKLYVQYISTFFTTPYAKAYLGGESVGTTMSNLNHKILSSIPVPLPPLAEQKRIVAKLEEILPLCERLK